MTWEVGADATGMGVGENPRIAAQHPPEALSSAQLSFTFGVRYKDSERSSHSRTAQAGSHGRLCEHPAHGQQSATRSQPGASS